MSKINGERCAGKQTSHIRSFNQKPASFFQRTYDLLQEIDRIVTVKMLQHVIQHYKIITILSFIEKSKNIFHTLHVISYFNPAMLYLFSANINPKKILITSFF